MKYLFIVLIATHFIIYSMDNKPAYQFNSQDKLKRFSIADKKTMNGKFQNQTNITICDALKISPESSPDQIKKRFFARYNYLNKHNGPKHRDVKLLKLMGIEHHLLEEDGEPIEYGDPIILSDEEQDITKDEAIEFIEQNQVPPRTRIIQLEQHHIEHPEWLDYMPAFLKLGYGWWKER